MNDELTNEPPASATPSIPHVRIVAAVTGFTLAVFALVTGYILGFVADETIRGAVIGAWSSMATAAAGFWLGSSSGGKLAGGK